MSFASGSRVSVKYALEATRGVQATGPYRLLRSNSMNINPQKTMLRSEETRPDRQTVSMRHGAESGEGTIAGELMLANHDDWLEAALSGTWTGGIVATTDIGVTAPDQVVSSGGDFVANGFRPGDIVELGNLVVTSEDGLYRATQVGPTAMTLVNLDGTAAALTTEAENATPTLDLKGERLDIGTVLRTFSVERAFEDIGQFEVFLGVPVNTMSISIQPDSIPTIEYGVLAMAFVPMAQTSIDPSPVAAPTNEAMSPFDGTIYEGGARIATLTGVDTELNNNRTLEEVVGNKTSPDVFEGDAMQTGTLAALFENESLYNKFVNETETQVWIRLPDPADSTEFLNIVMNRVKYTGSEKNPPRTGAVIQTMPFEALRDPVTGTTLSIQKSNT